MYGHMCIHAYVYLPMRNDLVKGFEVLSSALPIGRGLAEGLHPLALLTDKVGTAFFGHKDLAMP